MGAFAGETVKSTGVPFHKIRDIIAHDPAFGPHFQAELPAIATYPACARGEAAERLNVSFTKSLSRSFSLPISRG